MSARSQSRSASRTPVEAHAYAAFMRRVLRAYGRRMSVADPEDLADLVALRAELEDAIGAGARAVHASGRSWTEIAEALGVSRQAARQRYAQGPEA